MAIWSVDGVTARDFIKDRHDRSGIAGAGDVVLLAVFAYMPPFDFVTFGCLSPLQPGGFPAFQDFPHFVLVEKFKVIDFVVSLNPLHKAVDQLKIDKIIFFAPPLGKLFPLLLSQLKFAHDLIFFHNAFLLSPADKVNLNWTFEPWPDLSTG